MSRVKLLPQIEKLKGVFAEDLFLIGFIREKGANKFDVFFHGSKRPVRAV